MKGTKADRGLEKGRTLGEGDQLRLVVVFLNPASKRSRRFRLLTLGSSNSTPMRISVRKVDRRQKSSKSSWIEMLLSGKYVASVQPSSAAKVEAPRVVCHQNNSLRKDTIQLPIRSWQTERDSQPSPLCVDIFSISGQSRSPRWLRFGINVRHPRHIQNSFSFPLWSSLNFLLVYSVK